MVEPQLAFAATPLNNSGKWKSWIILTIIDFFGNVFTLTSIIDFKLDQSHVPLQTGFLSAACSWLWAPTFMGCSNQRSSRFNCPFLDVQKGLRKWVSSCCWLEHLTLGIQSCRAEILICHPCF